MTRAPDPLSASWNEETPSEVSQEPLGLRNPLGAKTSLGLGSATSLLQFRRPLGARSLTVLDPSTFVSEASSPMADLIQPFNEFPFFEPPETSVRSSATSTSATPLAVETAASQGQGPEIQLQLQSSPGPTAPHSANRDSASRDESVAQSVVAQATSDQAAVARSTAQSTAQASPQQPSNGLTPASALSSTPAPVTTPAPATPSIHRQSIEPVEPSLLPNAIAPAHSIEAVERVSEPVEPLPATDSAKPSQPLLTPTPTFADRASASRDSLQRRTSASPSASSPSALSPSVSSAAASTPQLASSPSGPESDPEHSNESLAEPTSEFSVQRSPDVPRSTEASAIAPSSSTPLLAEPIADDRPDSTEVSQAVNADSNNTESLGFESAIAAPARFEPTDSESATAESARFEPTGTEPVVSRKAVSHAVTNEVPEALPSVQRTAAGEAAPEHPFTGPSPEPLNKQLPEPSLEKPSSNTPSASSLSPSVSTDSVGAPAATVPQDGNASKATASEAVANLNTANQPLVDPDLSDSAPEFPIQRSSEASAIANPSVPSDSEQLENSELGPSSTAVPGAEPVALPEPKVKRSPQFEPLPLSESKSSPATSIIQASPSDSNSTSSIVPTVAFPQSPTSPPSSAIPPQRQADSSFDRPPVEASSEFPVQTRPERVQPQLETSSAPALQANSSALAADTTEFFNTSPHATETSASELGGGRDKCC